MVKVKYYYYVVISLCLFTLLLLYVSSLLDYDIVIGSSYNTKSIIYKYLLKCSYILVNYFVVHSLALLSSEDDYDKHKDKLDIIFFITYILLDIGAYSLLLHSITTQPLNIDYPF